MHVPRIEAGRSTRRSSASISASRRRTSSFSRFPTAISCARARLRRVAEPKPTLRIASLAALRHPFSVDLYLEKVCARAKLVVVRLLGGLDYWRYGVDELAGAGAPRQCQLALLPGDRRADPRLDEASTLGRDAVQRIWRYFDEGGPDNMAACLAFFARIGAARRAPRRPRRSAAFGRFEAACFDAGPGAARR